MKNIKQHQRGNDYKLIDLKRFQKNRFHQRLLSLIEKPVEYSLALSKINAIYNQIQFDQKIETPFQTCLKALHVNYHISDRDLARIPKEGPVVITANHPFGGIEGLILAELVSRVRKDVRILANYLLHQIPELKEYIIAVDPFGRKGSTGSNSMAFRDAIRWLKKGGILITFPSGTVSHLRLDKKQITDPDWNQHIAGIIRRTESSVVPVFFPGYNGHMFQLLGLIHPLIRTMLLPRELVNKQSKKINVVAGNAISWEKIQSAKTDHQLIKQLRQRTYILEGRTSGNEPEKSQSDETDAYEDIIPAVDPKLIKDEIGRLPASSKLLTSGDFSVYIAGSIQIPNTVMEIGRLREITFRSVREGTGKSYDIDKFDSHYFHLFLWDHENNQIAGAYRIGAVDQILDQFGTEGLYTNTLFRLKKGMLEHIDDALELGRSWIREEYQRHYNCLSLLWKGIGQYIVHNKQYSKLFGPVSISQDYQSISKYLIIYFLKKHNFDPELSKHIHPYNPYKLRADKSISNEIETDTINDIDSVSLLVSEIEHDGKGVPILLRHYLKLNAKILSFNVDPDFSDCIDGLIFTDLTQTNPRLLRRFMGGEGFKTFSENWEIVQEAF